MRCVIRTPEAELYDGEVEMAVLPAVDGELGVLPRHASLILALGTGACRLKTKSGPAAFALSGGFSRVHKDVLTVLTTRCEPGAAIDRAAAEKGLADAKAAPATGADAREKKRDSITWARARLAAAARR